MLKRVTLARNPLEPDTWTQHEVEDVRDFLLGEFDEWPSSARIYHEHVSSATDVTPGDEHGIERLGELQGPFYVVVYPADPVTIIIAVVAVVVVAAVVLPALVKPPNPTLRNTQNQSPNNELSDRTNKPRPLSRIPDIFGTVRSTPDLLSVPYKVYSNHEEVEYAYMCIGRGTYEIEDIRDDNTLALDIPGTSVEVYGPNTSPNSGDAPQLRIGTAINKPVYDVARSNAVNGQVLRPPNDQFIRATNNIYFQTPNLVKTSAFDFTDKFASGDSLTISGAAVYQDYISQTKTLFAYNDGSFRFVIPNSTLPSEYATGAEIQLTGATFTTTDPDGFWSSTSDLSGVYTIASKNLITVVDPETSATTYYCRVVLSNPAAINPQWNTVTSGASASVGIRLSSGAELYNLNGTYTVLAVADTEITLSNPAAVNGNWSTLTTSPNLSPTLSTTGSKWVGPFILDKTNTDRVVTNFVATNGLYKDDGKNQVRFDVTLELEITPINADGSVRGAVQTAQATVEGSATYRSTRAVTLDVGVSLPGRVRVRARRVTNADLAYEGSVVDEIKWRDVYAFAPINVTNFGNVTTVQSVTYATAGALALKERKLNMSVTRKIPIRPNIRYSMSIAEEGWAGYGGAVLTQGASAIEVSGPNPQYGVLVPFFQIVAGGGTITVEYTISSASNVPIEIGFYDPAAWRAGPASVTPGTGSVTLTINSGSSVAGLLFVRQTNPGPFTVSNVRVTSRYSTTTLYATNRADDILTFIARDPYLGNRPDAELDLNSIYDSVESVRDYFGSDLPAEFCYTFDADNLSFEETAQAVSNACFCVAYRRGSVIKLNFEKETEDSLLLFNHRNKLPGSEVRTVRFGNQNNFDGVSLSYVSPDDDALITYYIPEDRSAFNPQEIETLGVRNGLQAYFHAWRAWNKIRYQNTITEFTATQEADLLVTHDRILVADNTRTGTQDGEVISQNLLEIEVSQPLTFTTGVQYNMFLQLPDGTVESIPAVRGSDDFHVLLSQAPRLPLALEDGLFARTSFILIGNNEPRGSAFLIVEKEQQSNFTSTVRAVNYDSRYYGQDQDYINGLVNEYGQPTI